MTQQDVFRRVARDLKTDVIIVDSVQAEGSVSVTSDDLVLMLSRPPEILRIKTFNDLVHLCVAHFSAIVQAELSSNPQQIDQCDQNLVVLLLVENHLLSSGTLSICDAVREWIRTHHSPLEHAGLSVKEQSNLSVALACANIREAFDIVATNFLHTSGVELLQALHIDFAVTYPDAPGAKLGLFQRDDRPIQYWVDADRDGPLLFMVYYSGKCSYLICFGCALPSLSASKAVPPQKIFEQTDHVMEQLMTPREKTRMRSLFLSNNGSMFDDPTFSPVALHHAIVRAISVFPKLEKIVLETRAEFVTDAKLKALKDVVRDCGSTVRIELALGVEAFDDKLRNKVAKKGLSLRGIERLVSLIGAHDIDLRCYFMLKPHPSMTDEQAYADIAAGLDFLDELSVRTGTRIVMHLNPTYVAIGTDLETAFAEGKYIPPRLDDLWAFVKANTGRPTRIHLGLNDEGLAVDGGSFLRQETQEETQKLRRHNMVSETKTPTNVGARDAR